MKTRIQLVMVAMIFLMAAGLSLIVLCAFAPHGGSDSTPLVAARVVTINATDTSKTLAIPNLRVGKVVGAWYAGTAAKSTNTMVSSAYCATAGTAVVVLEAACFTTGTYYVGYIPQKN